MIGISIKCSNNLVNAMGGARDRRHSVPFVLKNRDYSMIPRVQVCSQGAQFSRMMRKMLANHAIH